VIKPLSQYDPEAKHLVTEDDDVLPHFPSTTASLASDSIRPGPHLSGDGVVKFPIARDRVGDTPSTGHAEHHSGMLTWQIGQILVHSRRMHSRDVDRVLKYAVHKKLRFGEAALRLGLIGRPDLDFALARQFSLPYVKRGETGISAAVIAAHSPSDPVVEPFRALRGQIAMSLSNDAGAPRPTLAVVGATRREGRSFTASNLAVVFAQLGRPTVLVDANLRSPAQQQLFGLDHRTGLSTVLAHRSGLECVHRIAGLSSLHVLPAGPTPPNPLELLEQPRFAEVLAELERKFEVVILDTPAGCEGNDGPLLAQRAGAALVVASAGRTRVAEARHFAQMLERARARVLGLVFNQKR